jgi:hypothetical protein
MMQCSQCEAFKLELERLESELTLAKIAAKLSSGKCEEEKVQKLGSVLFLTHKLEKLQREYTRHKGSHTTLFRVK